jgi:hypothetical protein
LTSCNIPQHPVSDWRLWNEGQSYLICITDCVANYMPHWLNK